LKAKKPKALPPARKRSCFKTIEKLEPEASMAATEEAESTIEIPITQSAIVAPRSKGK
jgi:hypothetical protein